ncbi:hypothetical protein AAMO2058_000848700 [Amorphochlora amoebiformis]
MVKAYRLEIAASAVTICLVFCWTSTPALQSYKSSGSRTHTSSARLPPSFQRVPHTTLRNPAARNPRNLAVRVREDEIYPDFWEIKKNNLNRQLPADGSFIMENIVYPPIDQKPPPLRGRPTWNKFTNDSMAHILKTRPILEYLDLLNDTETAS